VFRSGDHERHTFIKVAARTDIPFMSAQFQERRRGYRQKASAEASLRLLDRSGEPISAHVFELSMHGVGLSVRHEIAVGTILGFEMCDGRQSGTCIEVRSCRARSDNMFDIGGQFC
jgi:hypothetical protein